MSNSEKNLEEIQEVNQEEVEYRRVSDLERGDVMVPLWVEKNEEVVESLKRSFPYRAEVQWRSGKGKRQIVNHKVKGQDFFDPKYDRCPAPIKDDAGEYSKRCAYKVPEKPSPHDYKEFKKPANRQGIFEKVGIKQWLAMRHMQKEHFDWFIEECGHTQIDNQGRSHSCPPEYDIVEFPEWNPVLT